MNKDKFYITTPIYYVNDNPHLGHIYTTVVADAIARHMRSRGRDVFFLTGTDEHGQKVEKAAAKQGISPKELADRVVHNYLDLWTRMGIQYSQFIRTTDAVHERGVQRLFDIVRSKGDIYAGEYEGWYCTSCEKFVTEREIQDRRCPDCFKETEILKERCYYFRLSKYQVPLLDYYRANPGFIRPESRYNEVTEFVRGGLRDLSVTRSSVRWGIPVPDDPEQVIYVWFDALTNYLTGIGYGTDEESFLRRWPATLHLVGKDILRFHAVYWPAFLMSAGLPLPQTVFAHGWWLQDDRKMSKSLGNVFNPGPLIDRFGPDPLRYFLLREVPLGLDSNFSEEAVVDRYNYDLANDLGNLNSRIQRLFARALPPAGEPALVLSSAGAAEAGAEEQAVSANYYRCSKDAIRAFEEYAPSRAMVADWEFVNVLNRYVAVSEPWTLLDDPVKRPRLLRVLLTCAEGLRAIALLVAPALPGAAQSIADAIGAPQEDPWEFRPDREFRIRPSHAALFPRIENHKPKEVKKVEEPKKVETEPISIEEFQRVELRVAQVVSAERVEGTKKLMKLVVDIGTEKRQIVAGIAEAYEPQALVGKKIIVVVNLRPAMLRGVESRGMLLAATVGGSPTIATFEGDPPPGALVK
ncbi:MAG: methionine--tRNA ligase [Acidobacteriota bacterium]